MAANRTASTVARRLPGLTSSSAAAPARCTPLLAQPGSSASTLATAGPSSLARTAFHPAFPQQRALSTSAPRWSQESSASAEGSSQKACASCQTVQPLTSLACPSCGTLQPLPNLEPAADSGSSSASSGSSPAAASASGLDIYELFGLKLAEVPQSGWAVDERELKGSWRRLMGLTHPDRMGNRSEKEQQIAAQQSAVINRAYETLLNPLLRAQYLLERNGIPPADESDSLEDAELLMEVMELRERLEEAGDEDEAASVRTDNREHLARTLSSLSTAFSASPPDFDTARKLTVELRYWLNIDKAAREWAPGKRVELQH